MNNNDMRTAFNDGRLFDLSGMPITDIKTFTRLNPSNCIIKDAAPATVTTADVVATVTVDSPYETYRAQLSQAYKGTK